MSNLMQNHFKRLWAVKERMILMGVLMLCSIGFAIYTSHQESQPIRIGVVNSLTNDFFQSKKLKYISLAKNPSVVTLIQGEYDAIVISEEDTLHVRSLKPEKFNQQLKNMIQGNDEGSLGFERKKQEVGSKILGFLLLFLLLTSVTNMFLYTEDREKRVFSRIVSSPISRGKLLISYCLVNFITIYCSSLFGIIVAKLLEMNVGFSMLHYSLFLALICLFSTSFSLVNATWIPNGDQSNMFGSMIVILTTLLSGSFFSVGSKNRWIDSIIQWLPQKQFLTLVTAVENGSGLSQSVIKSISYLCLLTMLLFLFSNIKVKIENK